jgi:hypothetical protein
VGTRASTCRMGHSHSPWGRPTTPPNQHLGPPGQTPLFALSSRGKAPVLAGWRRPSCAVWTEAPGRTPSETNALILTAAFRYAGAFGRLGRPWLVCCQFGVWGMDKLLMLVGRLPPLPLPSRRAVSFCDWGVPVKAEK